MTNATQSELVEPAVGPVRSGTGGRSVRIWAPLLLLVLLLAGYLYRADRSGDPWRPVIAKAGRAAQSSFGRQVLADGSISRQEYAQANDRVVECARSKGVTFNLENRYGLVIFSSAGSNEAATLDLCESGDLAIIRSLYDEHYKDPRREGDAVYVRCLQKAGFGASQVRPPQGGTIDDVFDRLLDQSSRAEYPKVESCIYDPTGASSTR